MMSLEDHSGFLFHYGTIFWFSCLLFINIVGLILVKWKKVKFIELLSEYSIKEVFQCDLCLVEIDDTSNNEDESDSLNNKRYRYINKDCNNIEINLNKLKYTYYFHSNCTILFLGYLFLKIVLTIQTVSTVCLKGYRCMDNKFKDVCVNQTSTGDPSNNTQAFVCEKYGIESFDSFIINIGIFAGILKFIFEINKYIFKLSYKWTLTALKLLSHKLKRKYLLLIPSIMIAMIIALLVLSLIKIPGKNYVYSDEYYNAKLISCANILFVTIYAACSTANYSYESKEFSNKLYLVYKCTKDDSKSVMRYGIQTNN